MKRRVLLKIFATSLFFFFILATAFQAEGHVELGFHYGKWSVSPIRPFVEDTLEDALQKYILREVHKDYPELEAQGYSQEIGIDSSGQNFGFDIRLYPGGRNTSFSIGLSVEKTTMKASLTQAATRVELPDGTVYEGSFSSSILFEPLSFHLSLRWDLFPAGIVHPYFTLGVGVAKSVDFKNAAVDYAFSSKLTINGELYEQYDVDGEVTIEEFNEELKKVNEDVDIPVILPIFQLNLGIKAILAERFALYADFGIWNGFLFRGGIAYLF